MLTDSTFFCLKASLRAIYEKSANMSEIGKKKKKKKKKNGNSTAKGMK
jgi:hypothetical protein